MGIKQQALQSLFHNPDWEQVIEIEKNYREQCLLDMMRLNLNDPAFAIKAAYFKGSVETIVKLWALRDTIRKHGESPNKKGEENADNES